MEKKETVKNWLKDKHNLIFIGILILAILIRLYYFNATYGQPLWWDEADYLAYAKNLAGYPIDWIVTAKHNSLYPYLAAAIFAVGFGEGLSKFLLQFLPSVLSVLLVYLICNEMYKDKRIGLIASFLMAVLAEHLFNTTRFHIDILALFLGLLSIYVFWQGHENKKRIFSKIDSKWAMPIVAFLVVLTYSVRRGYFLFGLFFLIYVLATRNWKELFKDKYNWFALVLSTGLLFLVEKLIFTSRISSVGGAYFHEELPINFLPLKIFSLYFSTGTFLSSLILYLFWIGLLIILGNILLSFGYIRKTSDASVRSDLFNIFIIIITLAFFIFVLRSPANENGSFAELRWYFPLILSSFICISRSSLFLTDYLSKHSKHLSVILLVAIIALAGFYQVQSADSMIKSKIFSYKGTRDTALYLKEISQEGDLVITLGQPQIEYYSERSTLNSKTIAQADVSSMEHFEQSLEKIRSDENIKYIIISFSEPGHPAWMKTSSNTKWEIPFMETLIDFSTQKQDIKQEKTYAGITFTLADIKEDIFIYKISRS